MTSAISARRFVSCRSSPPLGSAARAAGRLGGPRAVGAAFRACDLLPGRTRTARAEAGRCGAGVLRRRVSRVAPSVAFARLIRIIRAFRPTIVHTHLQSASLRASRSRLARVPVVVATEHNVRGEGGPRILVERLLARMTDAMIAVSGPVRQFLSVQLAYAVDHPSHPQRRRAGRAHARGLAELRERLATDGPRPSVSEPSLR